jgi:Zn-dependent peptidase ImmA (M78 family)
VVIDYDVAAAQVLRYANIKMDTYLSTSPISFRRIFPCFNLIYESLEMEDTDALYVQTPNADYVYVNPLKPYTRRRFSIGHELGHFFLQHPFRIGLPKDHRLEVQANKFAEAILMPPELVWRVNRHCDSLAEVAAWFRVSKIAAAIRLKQFDLRVWECECVINDYWDEQGDPVLLGPNSSAWGWDI